MKKQQMSQEELEAESCRLNGLITQASKAGLEAVKEMSKRPLSLEQMRHQIREHHRTANQEWVRSPIPSADTNDY